MKNLKLVVTLVLVISLLFALTTWSQASLNFVTSGISVPVGEVFDINFTNTIYTGNETTVVEITYDNTVFECVSSTINNTPIETIAGGIKVNLPNNYEGTLKFKLLKMPANTSENITFKSDDNGVATTTIFTVTAVQGEANPDTNTNKNVNENTNINTNNNTNETEYPSTGVESTLLFALGGVALVAVFAYARYRSL